MRFEVGARYVFDPPITVEKARMYVANIFCTDLAVTFEEATCIRSDSGGTTFEMQCEKQHSYQFSILDAKIQLLNTEVRKA